MDAREVALQAAGRADAARHRASSSRSGPTRRVRSLGRAAALGAELAGGLPGRRDPLPRPPGDRRRPRHAHLRARSHRRTNALARELRRRGHRRRRRVAIMCRNHRGFVEATVACAKLGAGALYLNTAFAGPQIADVLQPRRPGGGDLRRGVRRARRRGRRGAQALRRLERARRRAPPSPTLEQLIAAGADAPSCAPPARERPRRDPHLGHDRRAEGRRRASSPTRSSRPRRCSRRSRCRRARRR